MGISVSDLNVVPAWVGGALLGAIVAALGYVGKMLVEGWINWRQVRAARLARLLRLSSLLDASSVAFRMQAEHRNQLAKMLLENHPDYLPQQQGYDRMFADLYEQLSAEEAKLHEIIRSLTIHSLRLPRPAI